MKASYKILKMFELECNDKNVYDKEGYCIKNIKVLCNNLIMLKSQNPSISILHKKRKVLYDLKYYILALLNLDNEELET